ncbi:MAG: beta-propeller domain-containing protein, partial [Candidatus Poseidoniaceae archaeon]|nr:beta-propeller domain-containing protein [Candidatus Poseidoniaceae archaeon]
MQSKTPLSQIGFIISMILSLSLSGCLGVIEDVVEKTPIDDAIDIKDAIIDLPTEWNLIPPRAPTSPNLTPFTDCEELETRLKETILEEAKVQLLQAVEQEYYWGGGWAEDDAMMEMDGAVADSGAPSAGSSDQGTGQAQEQRNEGEDFSGTNNQEEGVDEADFIKTDGFHIYILNDGILTILGVPEYGQITFESEMEVEGNVREMMLDGDRLVLLSTVSGWHLDDDDPLRSLIMDDEVEYWWRSDTLTKFTVIDISNRSAPEPVRELYIEGYYMTAREVDGTVRMVNHGWMNI